ncbi:MAG: ornithine cyclodeaminase family protein [Deltaproteobacteria bacterium]|nr:ornithine cyclodeaminase family protein [Deltaproteobacteria bacterium]
MPVFLTNQDVERVLTMAECMDALEEAHRELAFDRAVVGPTFRILTPRRPEEVPGATAPVHHVYTSLSASILKWDVVCHRVDSDFIHYPVVDGRRRQVRLPGMPSKKFCGFVDLFNSLTGELEAVIHDGYLQKFRVAGIEALGTKFLAKRDARVLGLIGSGWQAGAAIQAHCLVRRFDLVKVYSPNKDNRERFARTWSITLGVPVKAVESAEEAVRGSDVVNAVTNALDPVIETDWLEPGMFITTVKDSNELELETLERADMVVTNHPGPMWVRYAIGGFEGFPEHMKEYWGTSSRIDWEHMPHLAEIIAGKRPGRQNDQEVIVLMVRGNGLQFAAVGHRVYELARARGLGREVSNDLYLQGREYIP